jgi:WD40 repeat protein
MRRVPRPVLILLPVLLAGGVWAWLTSGKKAEPALGPAPQLRVHTQTLAGVRFEAEHQGGEPDEIWSFGTDQAIRFTRGGDLLEYQGGWLVIKGIEFPSPRRGDVVRWKRDGSLLINGVAQQPLPQPRALGKSATALGWDQRGLLGADTLSLHWARTSRLLAAASGDGFVRVWDVERGKVKATLFHEPPKGRRSWGVRTAIAPDGKTVASANMYAPDVILWDVAIGKKVATLSTPAVNVRDVRFLSDDWLLEYRGERLLARHLAGDRSRVIELCKLYQSTDYLYAIPISSDGKTLVRYDGKHATVYRVVIQPDGVKLEPTGAIIEVGGWITVTAVSHDGNLLAVYNGHGGPNRLLAVYDAATGAVKYRLRFRSTGVINQVNSMCFFPDGKTLAVGGWLGSIRLYDLESRRERGWITAPRLRGLAISGDGKLLAAAFREEASLRVWGVAGLQQRNGDKRP